MKKTIVINEETRDLIEQLHYENIALSDLVMFLIKNDIDINNESYKHIYNQYLNKNIEYNIAKTEMANNFNIPNGANWTLNFDNSEVTYDDE